MITKLHPPTQSPTHPYFTYLSIWSNLSSQLSYSILYSVTFQLCEWIFSTKDHLSEEEAPLCNISVGWRLMCDRSHISAVLQIRSISEADQHRVLNNTELQLLVQSVTDRFSQWNLPLLSWSSGHQHSSESSELFLTSEINWMLTDF